MLFVLTGYFRPDVEARRDAVHEGFNEVLMQRNPRVRLGGPLYDKAGVRSGALMVLEAPDFEVAEAFARSIPYQQAGLYDRVEISEVRPEVGSLG